MGSIQAIIELSNRIFAEVLYIVNLIARISGDMQIWSLAFAQNVTARMRKNKTFPEEVYIPNKKKKLESRMGA